MNRMLEDLRKLKDVYSDSIEVEIGRELKIKLRNLSSEEETDVHSAAMVNEQGIAYLYAVKRETILRSILALNGKEIPEVIEENNEKVQRYVWLRNNVVRGWSQTVIDQIWNHYLKLTERLEKRLGIEVKTEEDKKEA